MYPTPSTYNNDPARIHRAELRALQAQEREARKAMTQSGKSAERAARPGIKRALASILAFATT